MNLGKLNELLSPITFSYHFAGTDLIPQSEIEGDPTKGELLQIRWANIRDEDLAFDITLPQEAFVDTVLLHFGPKTALNYAKLLCDGKIVYTHSAETGMRVKTPCLSLEAGRLCRKLTLLLSADFASVQLENIELFGAVEEGPAVFPTPESIILGEGKLMLSALTGCCAQTKDECQAAEKLAEKLAEITGTSLPVASSGNIRFVTDTAIPVNGYTLSVTPRDVQLCAGDLRGFVSGGETLIKLVQENSLPCLQITDRPFKPFRGVHLFIPSAEKMEFAKRLIKYLISPMGYNVVILQVSGGMIYERHPEISAAFAHAVSMRSQGWPAFPHNGIAEGKPITKAQLKEYIAYIRSFGIDVIPEVQSLAHVQYLTHAFPEIAEIAQEEINENVDTRAEDMLPSKFYHHDYCPSNPRTYEILFDVIDEIIEVFEPREYVHMGHDEVRTIGKCPLCKDKTPAELLSYDINKIHAYLASKGLKMMIWADMLQPMPKYPTHPAIDMIPKDIVLLDFIWYFHMDQDIENNLLTKDFNVLLGNLYSSHFPRYENRIRQAGIHGGQISAWVATNEYELQKEGKLYDFFMTAQLLWAESYNRNYRLVYDRMIQAQMPKLRENLNGIRYPSRQVGATAVTLGENKVTFPPTFPVVQETEFAVNGCFNSLIFHHTALRRITRQPWLDLDVVAKYIITYADGEEEEVPVTYGGNLGYWNRRQNAPLRHGFYRHTGYTATYYADSTTDYTKDGQVTTTYVYEYLPKHQAPIAAVRLEEDPAFQAKVVLQKLEGVRTDGSNDR